MIMTMAMGALSLLALTSTVTGIDNGLARTPPMTWSSAPPMLVLLPGPRSCAGAPLCVGVRCGCRPAPPARVSCPALISLPAPL